MELGTQAQGLRASRRNVVRGAAWSVPVIAVATAAPAFAASPCDAITITNFSLAGGTVAGPSGARTWERTQNTAVSGGGTSALRLSATSGYSGSMARAADIQIYSHFGTTANAGATNTAGLQMFQARGTGNLGANGVPADHAGTYAYTFSRPVTNLEFTLSDIDYYSFTQQGTTYRQYDDRVAVTSSSAFTVASRGANIVQTSAGTLADPFRTNNTGQTAGNIDLDEGAGNVVVRFAGPVSSFSIVYWNGFNNANTDSRIQVALLSDMSFTYNPCP